MSLLEYVNCLSRVRGDPHARFCGEGVSRIRAERVAFARFSTLSSEPDLQLSLHPALQGFESLRFFRSLHFRSCGTFTALLLLVDCSATFNPLPPFALWLAFPTSDYYDGSDSLTRHRLSASLNILVRVSHVHVDRLYEIV